MQLPEDELVAAIGRVLSGAGPEVRVGPGDDAAVLAPGSGDLVLTADAMVEDVHFTRSITLPRDLGYKAIVVSLSDIAAMGASPRAALVILTLPADIEAAWVMELYGGMREACDEHALWLVGGDLSRGGEIGISVSVTGEVAPGRAVTRSGASAGDVVAVTGALGGSAAGLRVMASGRIGGEVDRALLRAHIRPAARVGEGGALARHGATAMMDVSDGLAKDLGRLALASGAGAVIRSADVPVAEGAALRDALGGGEDYELLVTLPPERFDEAVADLRDTFGTALTAIGSIDGGSGLRAVGEDGVERPLEPSGWDHFAGRDGSAGRDGGG